MALKPCPHCGHPISEQAEKCPCCHQDPHLTPEQLAEQQEAEQKRRKAQRKRVLLIGGICAAVVLVAAGVCAALFLPAYQDYRAACDLLEQQKYVEAAEAFDAMADYRDSAQQALEARYQYVSAHRNRDDRQTREYLNDLLDAKYKDAAAIWEQVYAWRITATPCASKTGGPQKLHFQLGEPLFFYVEVKGGPIAGLRHLRYEATIRPTMYWRQQGVAESKQGDDMGTLKNGSTYWFGWEKGIQSDVIDNIDFTVYDANTGESLVSSIAYLQ